VGTLASPDPGYRQQYKNLTWSGGQKYMARRIIREGKIQPQSNGGGITRITVGGFKSIVQEQSIEIKPLRHGSEQAQTIVTV
jgi:hypothetical protein